MRRSVILLLAALSPAAAQTPAPGPVTSAPGEDLTRFEYHQVQLRPLGGRWHLVENGRTLKEFARESEARQALKLIHDLRLTHHGLIGTPEPVIEYWLSEGQPPRGLVRGLRLTPLDTATVRAEIVQEQWTVRDAHQVLFTFGPHRQDAERAAEVIRRYGFNKVGFVGLGTPSMMYFLVHHDNKDATQVVTPTSTPGGPADGGPRVVLPLGAVRQPPQGQVVKPSNPEPNIPALSPFNTRQLADPAAPTARAVPGARVERTPFDWRRAEVKRDGNDWKLVAGSVTLAHFGRSERDAKQALTMLQRYQFTERCTIGGPKPECSYYLTYGKPPRGLYFGISQVAFRPEALAIQEREGGFALTEGSRVLVQFEREADARQALHVVQQHRFDHWCHVGRPGQEGMTFFVKAR